MALREKKKLTQAERTRRLRIVLLVVLLVAGLGGQVILPLLEKMEELQGQLTEAGIEKAQREVKVTNAMKLEKTVADLERRLQEMTGLYNGVLSGKDVDAMLTNRAISYGATVKGLAITMPQAEDATVLWPYAEAGTKRENLAGSGGNSEEQAAYSGFSTAKAVLSVTGDRQALQGLLDDLSHRTPAMRVESFQWEEGDGRWALSISLEIYMMQDINSYIERQQEAE